MREKCIFLVEDNPDDRDLARRALKRMKVDFQSNLLTAADGEEALEYLFGGGEAAGKPLPDLILLDINMPRVNGLQVLQRIREEAKTRFTPVVILTTSREESDLEAAYLNGANSFVRKPVEFGKYLEVLQEVAVYWLTVNQPVHPSDFWSFL